MIIYLYVKTHRKTGLKYLGMTTKKNPHKYRGSGDHWKAHIKKYGYDVDTEILRECKNFDEIKEWGLYYSELWNVVKDRAWANKIPEEGTGFTGETSTNFWTSELRAVQRDRMKNQWEKLEYRDKMTEQALQLWKNEDFRKANSERKVGENNPRYDHTIYHFVNDDGKEEFCTRNQLYKKYSLSSSKVNEVVWGNRNQHKGWRIKR